jgi:hypothetical protein
MGFDNDHLGTLMPFGAPSTPSSADGLTTRSPKACCHSSAAQN